VTLAIGPAPDGDDTPLRSVRVGVAGTSLLLELHRQSGHLHVRAEGNVTDHRAVAMKAADDAELIASALDDSAGSSLYLDACRAALFLYDDA
jgi:pyruvate/2-oxoglutarate dehydrogenase complex dihydrolipoamide dehydrogenase (E3) component